MKAILEGAIGALFMLTCVALLGFAVFSFATQKTPTTETPQKEAECVLATKEAMETCEKQLPYGGKCVILAVPEEWVKPKPELKGESI